MLSLKVIKDYMVPVPEVDSFQELNDLLRQRCLAEAGRRLRGETETIGKISLIDFRQD